MANNLALRVTADIADAQAKLSVLNAEFKATQTQINALSRAGAAGNLDAAGAAQLQALTTRSLELQAAAQPLATTVAEAGFAVKGLGAAAVSTAANAEQLGINMSSATRYTRELFDEITSGRTRYLPSTLAELAQAGFHIQPAMLAAGVGVAGLAAGLGYLAYRAIEASHALDQINLNNLMAGNDFSRGQLQHLTDQIAQLPHVGTSSAQELVSGLSQIHLPFEALQASARLAAETMEATGQKASQVGKVIAKALSPAVTATQVAKQYQNDLTQSQVNAAEAADKSGNSNAVLAEKLQLLEAPLNRARAKWQDYAHSTIARTREVMGAAEHLGEMGRLGGMGQTMPQIQAQNDPLKKEAQAWLANADAVKHFTSAVAALPAEKTLTFKEKVARGHAAHMRPTASLSDTVGKSLFAHQQEIANQLPRLMSDAQRQAAQQSLAIQHEHASASQQVQRIQLQTKKEVLDSEVAAGKVSAGQALATERQLTAQLYQEDIKRLQNELSTLPQGSAAYARVADQIMVAKAREAQELAGYDARIQASAATAVTSQVGAWHLMADEVMATEGNLVQNIISGRRTLGGSLRAMGQELVAQEIMQDAQAMTARLLLHGQLTEKEKALEQGGVLFHALSESQKTAITVTGETARTAATEMAHLKRLALKEASEAKSLAITIAHALKRIGIDAAEAGAGAFKAMVGIPYVGPILAVAASAAAILEVKKLAHFEQGAWEIPGTMHAILHAGETVLPRPFAQDYRSAVSGRGGAGMGGGGGDTHLHVHATDAESVERLFHNNGAALAQALGAQLRNGWRP